MKSIEQQRATFEAWHRRKFATRHNTGQPTRDMHNGVYDENYGPVCQQHMWEAFQAAIEFDRQARGEPVGYVHPNVAAYGVKEGAMIYSTSYFVEGAGVPVYLHPQPAEPTVKESLTVAEPVKVPSDAEIIDLAVEPLKIDFDRMPYGVVNFARALLARYGQPAQPTERGDLLTIAYMSGVYDGKKAAQPAASAEPVVTDVMHAHFEGIYNGLDLAERTEIIEGILKLAAPVAAQPSVQDAAAAIHYPDCWDTAAYPTLSDALRELYAWFKCSNDECGDAAK